MSCIQVVFEIGNGITRECAEAFVKANPNYWIAGDYVNTMVTIKEQ